MQGINGLNGRVPVNQNVEWTKVRGVGTVTLVPQDDGSPYVILDELFVWRNDHKVYICVVLLLYGSYNVDSFQI